MSEVNLYNQPFSNYSWWNKTITQAQKLRKMETYETISDVQQINRDAVAFAGSEKAQ